MTFPRPAAFPGGRVLAGWWKQLGPWRPQSLWVGSIGLERIEALCNIRQTEPLAPLDRLLLTNLSVDQPTDTALLNRRLGVGELLLTRLLSRLEQSGTVAQTAHGWMLTDAGHQARAKNLLPGSRIERRSFWFIAQQEDACTPAFVAPANPGAFQAVESSRIHHRSLEALLESSKRDPAWKQVRHFPLEVDSIIAPETASPANDLAAWEKIVIVHPYRLQAALITYVRDSGQPGLAAFAYQEHGWSLGAAPVFDLAATWQEIFPGLPLEPTEAMIAEAWRKWLAQRGLAGPVMDQYRLERRAEKIGVVPPEAFPELLGGPRGDLARGEAWLVLQERALRRVIPLEMNQLAKTARQDLR